MSSVFHDYGTGNKHSLQNLIVKQYICKTSW